MTACTGLEKQSGYRHQQSDILSELDSGFGSINKHKLYEAESGRDNYQEQYELQWDPSKMETFQEEEYSKSAYQTHLENEEIGITTEAEEDDVEMNGIKTWSDFNRVYFHPKSMLTISGYLMDSDFMPFDVFSYGRTAFLETEKELDSYDDNFRLFAEECDQLQGFQVLADVLNGWGGFASSYLERLREDFPKSTVITYGLGDNEMGKRETMKDKQVLAVNETLAMTHLSKLSSLYVPVQAPDQSMLAFKGWSKNIWMDVRTNRKLEEIRLRSNSILMADMVGSLNWRNITTIGTLSVGLPFPFGASSLPQLVGKESPLLDLSSRKEDLDDQVFSQSVVLRGLETDQFARYATGTRKTPREIVDELLSTLPIGKSLGDTKIRTPVKYPIPTSYPRFFHGLTPEGYQSQDPYPPNLRPDGTSKVHSVPTITRLAVSSTTRWHLESLSNSIKKIDLRLLPQFDGDGQGGVNREEFEEAKESLLDMYDVYNE
ncbi:mtDNA inheritance, partitioning of the mitochondrial organelle [Mortierella sp. NVP85]|nr:mtDNA inheritance, partitioning of the mitochondrial organelle [Mortierella sp. NVP85]